MKLHIVKPEQESIENYTRVDDNPDGLDLSTVSDNECTVILANDILDWFHIDNVPQLLEHLVKKVRVGGELVVGGTDIRLFGKAVANDQIDEMSAARLIASVQSMTTFDQTSGILKAMGLKILSAQISGIHYEVKVSRG